MQSTGSGSTRVHNSSSGARASRNAASVLNHVPRLGHSFRPVHSIKKTMGPPEEAYAAAKDAPRIPGIPFLGPLQEMRLDSLFIGITKLHKERKSRVIRFTLFGDEIFCLRHPDDIVHVMRTHAERYVKPKKQMARLRPTLGDGLFTLDGGQRHAQAKAVLDPLFRADVIRGLIPSIAQVGEELVTSMCVLASKTSGDVEVETLCRSATLDVLGLTTLDYDLKALKTARGESKGIPLPSGPASSAGPSPVSLEVSQDQHHLPPSVQQVPPQQSQQTHRNEPQQILEQALQQLRQNQQGASSNGEYADPVKLWDAILGPVMLMALDIFLPDKWIPGFPELERSLAAFDKIIYGMIEQKKKEQANQGEELSGKSKDLVSAMLRAQADGNSLMTDQHIRDEVLTFMLAGSDTSAETLAFCLYELSKHPEVAEKVHEEVESVLGERGVETLTMEDVRKLSLLGGCVNESLRMYPAGTDMAREPLIDDVLPGGDRLPKGKKVVLNIYSLHRHEDFWPRPDEWLPERWLEGRKEELGARHPEAFQAFSTGGRACIGRYFAVLEVTVLAAVVLRRLRLCPASANAPPVTLRQTFTLKSGQGVYLGVSKRGA